MVEMKLVVSLMIGLMMAGTQADQHVAADVKSDEAILARRYDALDLKSQTPSEALRTILNGTGIPGGIVMAQSEISEPKYSFVTPAGWTLRQVLDYMTSVATSYEWRIDSGVVNLVPKGRLPAMLDVRIAKFDFEDTEIRSLLEQRLLELPETRRRATELGLEPAPVQTGLSVYIPPGEKRPPPRPYHLRNITLLEALNAIAKAREGGFWRYIEETNRGRTYLVIVF